jgi:hypothetical protein
MSMGIGDEPAVPYAWPQLTWNDLSRIVSCLLFFACRFSVFGLRGSWVLPGGDVEGGGSKDNEERWEESDGVWRGDGGRERAELREKRNGFDRRVWQSANTSEQPNLVEPLGPAG